MLAMLVLLTGCPAPETLTENGLPGDEQSNAESHPPLPEVDPNDSQLLLLAEAEQIVVADYPQSTLVEARGTPAGETAATADDIVAWQFLFMENKEVPGAGTVTLEYANGEFSEPVLLTQGLVGTTYERLPRTMTLTTAIQFMRDAGHNDPFSQVILRKPLTFPVPHEAYYIFVIGDASVLVGMATGEVNQE